MPGLVDGHALTLDPVELRLARVAEDDLVVGGREVAGPNRVGFAPRRPQRRLVGQVGEIGPREPRGHRRNGPEVHVGSEGLVPGVDREDRFASGQLGPVDGHASVEAAGSQESRVEHVGPVGGREDNRQVVAREAIHLGQELVEGLFALVVSSAQPGTSRATDGVNLVDEDDGGRHLLGLLEEVTNALGAHSHEELDELGAAHGEERNARFSGDRPRKQRLARSRRSHEEDPVRHLAPQPAKVGGRLQEIDDLEQVALGALETGHVVELHLNPHSRDPRGRAGPRASDPAGLRPSRPRPVATSRPTLPR